MIVAGVTGGIGSGKSTLCRVWESLGAKVVYADDLAKKLMVEDRQVKESLKELFGEETYFEDGSLNKSHLIKEAFQKGRVEELNGVVHPAVRQKFQEIIEKSKKDGVEVLVKEAALLLNKGRPEELDAVIIVTSPKSDQIKRVQERDRVEKKDVLERMNKQPDFESLKSYADYIINNDGTIDEFKLKSKELYLKVLEDLRDKV
ncbi:dephospho-CoA kinase [Rhodohalobacter sp.]|uniref:dephospho-CoA kinase n=1 Tax=Rhodohalobacter sp. TaxID=1974210 RepID=UPI002ACDC8E3|nr:dephospho-CoA kinase [Rhodohalobacter sp.]MDZ7757490.1 dephospho-CoA kinase [Rhodohalobacter sp.]